MVGGMLCKSDKPSIIIIIIRLIIIRGGGEGGERARDGPTLWRGSLNAT